MRRIIILTLLIAMLLPGSGFPGTVILPGDSTAGIKKDQPVVTTVPYHRNVIKFNPTPMLLWGNVGNITFSYERLIKNDMSVSFQAGILMFPKVISDTVAGLILITGGKKMGINLGADYRYYPMARNRRPAPDGLYLGGYLSYYGYNFSNKLEILQTDIYQNGSINGRLNAVNLGINVGYQFIFWKRFSVDLLMFGPSLSYYIGHLGVDGALDAGEIADIDEELVNALLDKFPWLDVLFNTGNLQFTGSKTKLSAGLRFSVQFGYHF